MIPLLLAPPKVVYRGTITGLRISAIDSTAFIDNLPYIYSSDFSAGVNSWAAWNGSATGNIDAIGGEDNWIRHTCNTTNSYHGVYRSSTTITSGKKYTVTFKYYIPSGQSNVDGVRLILNSGGQSGSAIQTVTDAATSVTATFTATTTGAIEFWAYDGASPTFQDAGGDDVFYIKDVTISEITPYIDGNHSIEIYDSANNMLKGVLKAAGSGEVTTDLISGWNLTSGWTPTTGAAIDDSNSFTVSSAPAGVRANTNLCPYLSLIKITYDMTAGTTFRLMNVAGTVATIDVASGGYITSWHNSLATALAPYLRRVANGTTDITSMSCEQATAPSSSGATIVSAKAGEVYNFAYKHASFAYNAASYYCIIRAIR